MNKGPQPAAGGQQDRVFARCEHCRAVLPVRYADLGQAGGMVRCGSCGRTLNALAHLYPTFPDESTQPIAPSGMPPMLQPHVEQEQIIGSAETGDRVTDEPVDNRGPVLRLDLDPEPAPGWMRFVWPILAIVLAAGLMLQFVGPEEWRLDPAALGLGNDAPPPADDALQLVSRDMHPHPSLDDAFVISAVLVNRSGRTVPWPNIELKLFDASQQTVARRRLAPRDYLSAEASLDRGFAPDVRLPVVLEMVVEASRPSGFSMTFYY